MQTTKKLEVLNKSLEKKQAVLDQRLQTHFDTVKQANGQPLNDKRNGHQTMRKWEKQSNAIQNAIDEIERTKNAIEHEQGKVKEVEAMNKTLPDFLLKAVEDGTITQWRKYPNRFFVPRGGKARLIWKDNKLMYSHLSKCNKEEFQVFRNVANQLIKQFTENREG